MTEKQKSAGGFDTTAADTTSPAIVARTSRPRPPEHTVSALQPLRELADRGMQPRFGEIWLGVDFKPLRRNALAIESGKMPTDAECAALTGLDVILTFHGFATRYGTLRRLCGSIYQARPRRLMLIDLDVKKTAFLKMAVA